MKLGGIDHEDNNYVYGNRSVFAILAIGQFISYLGFISVSVFVCRKVLSRR